MFAQGRDRPRLDSRLARVFARRISGVRKYWPTDFRRQFVSLYHPNLLEQPRILVKPPQRAPGEERASERTRERERVMLRAVNQV